MDRPDPEIEYYRRVEDLFASLRGTPHILSPRDFQLLRGWWRDRVPFAAVVTGLTEVFTRARERGDDTLVASLSYCRHAVKRHAKRLAEMHVGGGDADRESSDAAAGDRVEDLAAALDAAAASQLTARPRVAQVIDRIADQLRSSAGELPARLLDEHLFELEATLLYDCWRALPLETRHAIDRRVSEVAGDSAANDDARRRRERALRDRELRLLLQLPRLEIDE